MPAKIVAVMNQKGGVGKTTTAVNLGTILAVENQRRVLLVDIDPQGSLSDHLGIDPNRGAASIYQVLVENADPKSVIRRIHEVDVLPADRDLSGAEIELPTHDDWRTRLRDSLEPLREQYDYILIDCPPTLGILTLSGLVAATGVMVPMEAEYFALRGISHLYDTLQKVNQAINPALELTGILFCMFDGRTTLAREVKAEVEKHFPGKVFQTVIRKNVRLAEAPSQGMSIIEYEPNCAGADDYRQAAREFLERMGDAAEASPVLTHGDVLEAIPAVPGPDQDIMAATRQEPEMAEVETVEAQEVQRRHNV